MNDIRYLWPQALLLALVILCGLIMFWLRRRYIKWVQGWERHSIREEHLPKNPRG